MHPASSSLPLAAVALAVLAFRALQGGLLSLGAGPVLATAAAEWMALGVAVLLVVWRVDDRTVRLGSLLSVRPVSAASLVAAVLMACAAFPVVALVDAMQSPWLSPGPAVLEAMGSAFAANGWGGFAILLLAAAVTPAVTEELLFRGLLLGQLRRLGPMAAVGLSALAFGLLHDWGAGGGFRVLPAVAVGILAGTLVWRCRSVLPAVVFHLVYNGVLLAAAFAPAGALGALVPASGRPPSLPRLAAGAAFLGAALYLVRKRDPTADSE